MSPALITSKKSRMDRDDLATLVLLGLLAVILVAVVIYYS